MIDNSSTSDNMGQDVTKKLKGMNGHAVAVGYGSPNGDAGHVVLGSSKRSVTLWS